MIFASMERRVGALACSGSDLSMLTLA